MGHRTPTLSRSVAQDPPGRREVRRRALPDTWEGIQFVIGRLVRYVQEARRDPEIIEATKFVLGNWIRYAQEMAMRRGETPPRTNDHVLQLEGIDIWCREHFVYVNDPVGIEYIQTPAREYRTTRIPREVMMHVLRPYFEAMKIEDPSTYEMGPYEPPPFYVGDCDEALALELGMCAVVGMNPIWFRFGGNGEQIHHIWGAVWAGGRVWDIDLTEDHYRLGDKGDFKHYEFIEVPL